MSRSRKGDRTERELVNTLYDSGLAVMRAPTSGGATDRTLPDVDAKSRKVHVAIEAKSSGGAPIYIDGEEIEDLLDYSTRGGMKARIGVRFDREDWYFLHPAEADFTDEGANYKITLEMAKERGRTLDELKDGYPCKPRNTASA